MKHKRSAVRRQYEKQNFDLFKPYLPWTFASNWWKNIKWFFRSFKLAAQRVKRGYSEYDVVNLDSYLTGLMACALDDFAERTCSIPQEYLDKYEGDEEKAFACWKEQLQSTSYMLFQSLEDLEDFNYNIPDFPPINLYVKDKNTTHLESLEKERKEYFKIMNDIYEARRECAQSALKWLRKYWWNLWI